MYGRRRRGEFKQGRCRQNHPLPSNKTTIPQWLTRHRLASSAGATHEIVAVAATCCVCATNRAVKQDAGALDGKPWQGAAPKSDPAYHGQRDQVHGGTKRKGDPQSGRTNNH